MNANILCLKSFYEHYKQLILMYISVLAGPSPAEAQLWPAPYLKSALHISCLAPLLLHISIIVLLKCGTPLWF